MEYSTCSTTPYVGMAPERNGLPIKCVENDMFITAVGM